MLKLSAGTSGEDNMKAISVAAILLLAGSAALAQTTEELNNDGKNTDNVLTYGMGYHQQRYSRAEADQQEHRQATGPGVEPQPRQSMGRAGSAAGAQWCDVRHQREADRRDRRRHRQADLAPHARMAARDATRRVLRRIQQRRRGFRRQGLPHDARRACGRARRQDRQGGLEDRRPTSGRKATP